MSFDGFVTHCVANELNNTLTGCKIDKIHQPERDEIVLQIRTQNGIKKLLLSASASHPRIHLTDISKENPISPPMLCMLMRKHLQGNKIIGISQYDFDRIIRIDTEGRNDLGDICVKSIIIEIMGRHSNIILVDENNKIMDCAKHVDFTVSAVRQVLPGLFYNFPPMQNKYSPENFHILDVLNALDKSPEDTPLDKFLLNSFVGMSPLIAREIVYGYAGNTKVIRSEVNTASFLTYVEQFLKNISDGNYHPSLIINHADGKPIAFSCVELKQYENCGRIENHFSISHIIDLFYEKKAQKENMNQRMSVLLKLINNNIDRCTKKITLHKENLEKSKNRDVYKIFGDLITANIYRMNIGDRELIAENYFSENLETVKIPLKEDISPSQNAQRYYKLYSKAKITEKYAVDEITKAENEKYYLESVLESLEIAENPTELAEIRNELADEGYVPQISSKLKKYQKKTTPYRFISSNGFEILVGRNNKQNDELTIKMAYSTDIWLHTKFIPGSHTIIRTQGGCEVPDKTIIEAAQLAAYYSKAKNSSKVPVDYTTVKNVKKPNGAKPGMVIYDHYNTIYVEPTLIEPKPDNQ